MKALIILLVLMCNNTLADNSKERSPSEIKTFTKTGGQTSDTNLPANLRIRPFHLEIVPPSSGVQFYRNGIIFLAHSKLEEKVPDRHLSFGSIRTYTSEIGDSVPGAMIPVNLNSSALFPSEATTFSVDFNTMYFSLIPEKANSEKIFKAENTSDGWKIEEKPLQICNENYIYSHPCLSHDGTFMVFSSDVAGTSGGLDLWITKKNGEEWSNPVNLGKHINSSGNELFASLDSENNLYFSSDGHQGKGGYDIFVSRYNGSGWDKPGILPGIINTNGDELAFTINKTDNSTAFYTVRSRSGKNRTQLYLIDINLTEAGRDDNNLSECFLAALNFTDANQSDDAVETKHTGQTRAEATPSARSDLTANAPAIKDEVTSSSKPVQISPKPELKKEEENLPKQETKTSQSEVNKEKPKEAISAQVTPSSDPKKDEVIYRVQILANMKPAGSQNIVVAGENYKSFEYLYKGGYRTTIGEFRTLAEATRLQSLCRQNGYGQAFVVAFKNNVRSTDPELFK